jgi:hypothetical protein
MALILVLLGAGVGYLGFRTSLDWLTYPGAIVAGLGVTGFGVEAIVTRTDHYEVGDGEAHGATETYQGLAAVLSGLVMAMTGLAIIGTAAVVWLGLVDGVLSLVVDRPGGALAVGGIGLVAYGGAPVGAPTRQHSRPSPTKEANPERRARAYPRIPYGGTLVLGTVEDRRHLLAMLGSLPGRVFGAVLVAAGLALVALGAFETVAPAAYDDLIDSIGALLDPA